ncbi:MAG TPA: tetratricopeptide repeat protein [Blastocatellia bacterium]|nr:tetratricopeptide repeat protein [Blastocatellia bacterium]
MSLNKSKVLRTAEKYVLQGKIPAAIDEYRKVVSADPGDLTTINTLGDLYVRAGRIQDAIANFSRIADSYREGGFTLKAIAMLKKISKLDPTNIETAMKLANLYSQQGLLVEARQQYLQVADAYARAGQTRKALEAYQKIADLDPSNTSVRMKLGEIYSREAMTEQAHDAFIMAGGEFLRKGDIEQALNANLKAIVINPDSRQALTAIATIYSQQGQTDRAINVLCEAFERNPGDVELLTILGRTYLSAGMMDDAERTFLSLVELDRNRYHYLLEVGRRFLQIGDLDRASEQVDGCIEVLIAKREEDKAIEFLRRVLDKEIYHVGALKRLAQIFLRIREDHNLIATLNSLVEAAMRKGDNAEAIAALKELARLEPDEPLHLQRLYNLGVQDISEGESSDVVRATGPLDFQSAAFDDTFVIRQISEAEILAGHGQVSHAVEILTAILVHAPENVQVHLKLKDIYLRAGIMDKASEQCIQLARIHESRGETARASDFLAEAHQLNPLIDPADSAESGPEEFVATPTSSFRETVSSGTDRQPVQTDDAGFEIRDSSGVDWSKYNTGGLSDGFVTIPDDGAGNGTSGENVSGFLLSTPESRYGGTLVTDGENQRGETGAEMFTSASLLPSDTMPRVLRDELEGIDFYIAQGYVEIAKDTLDRLRDENGDHPEVLARYKRLGESFEPSKPIIGETADYESFVELSLGDEQTGSTDHTDYQYPQLDVTVSQDDSKTPDYEQIEPDYTAKDDTEDKDKPVIVQSESGPLYPDLLVQFNTSELHIPFDQSYSGQQQFQAAPPLSLDAESENEKEAVEAQQPTIDEEAVVTHAPAEERIGTGDLLASLVSGIDASFDEYQDHVQESIIDHDDALIGSDVKDESSQTEIAEGEAAHAVDDVVTGTGSDEFGSARDELQEIFDELKGQTGDLKPLIDFETHYSLGLAYKDMELLDEAISEFQMAFRTAGVEDLEGDCINCCNMLGVCFKQKQIPKVAIMWFERGLKIPNRAEDEYQALRYEIGICYEEMGEIDKAIEAFTQVYGIDVNYRRVGDKIKELQAVTT